MTVPVVGQDMQHVKPWLPHDHAHGSLALSFQMDAVVPQAASGPVGGQFFLELHSMMS